MYEKRKKLKILFDAQILCYYFCKNSSRSGIYFVAFNLLQEFCKIEDIEVNLYYDYKLYQNILQLKNVNIIPKNCNLMRIEDLTNPLIGFLVKLKIKCTKTNDNLIKKVFRFVIARIFRLYDKCKRKHFTKKVEKYDVFFSPCEKIPIEIHHAKKIKPYLLIHDIIPITMQNFYQEFNSPYEWMATLIKSITPKDNYFAISEYTKQDLINNVANISSDNIVVTPLAANDNFYQETDLQKITLIKEKYNIPADKKYIFSLCTLEPRKNLLFAVKNFLTFVKKHNIENCIFVLGGAAWKDFLPVLEQNLQNFENYEDKILKIGYVDDEDIRWLYSASEAFVYPSLYEGFGLPVLEAMKCGCPVITSNLTSIPEVIGDAGIQINPYSDEEMLAAYEKMYFDKNFRDICVKKGLERAQTFSWNKTVKIMIETFYKELG